MIKFLVETIRNEAQRIAGIKSFKYQGVDEINAQNNNSTIQVVVEDDIQIEYLVTKDISSIKLNIDILDKVEQDTDIVDVHNNTYKIGIVLMKLLDRHYEFINIHDFSIMTLSKFSDDVLYGSRLSLTLFTSNMINECNLDDYLDETNVFDKEDSKEVIQIQEINLVPKRKRKDKK
jgi:hypothetical protein